MAFWISHPAGKVWMEKGQGYWQVKGGEMGGRAGSSSSSSSSSSVFGVFAGNLSVATSSPNDEDKETLLYESSFSPSLPADAGRI